LSIGLPAWEEARSKNKKLSTKHLFMPPETETITVKSGNYRGTRVAITFGEPIYTEARHEDRLVGSFPYTTTIDHGGSESGSHTQKHSVFINSDRVSVEGLKEGVRNEFRNGTSLSLIPVRKITHWRDYFPEMAEKPDEK
jgi:hypothetical protein